jgi:hypothetical protein
MLVKAIDAPERKKGLKKTFRPFLLKTNLGEIRFSKVPVHQFVEEGLNKLWAHIAVVDVIGMFPNVNGQ